MIVVLQSGLCQVARRWSWTRRVKWYCNDLSDTQRHSCRLWHQSRCQLFASRRVVAAPLLTVMPWYVGMLVTASAAADGAAEAHQANLFITMQTQQWLAQTQLCSLLQNIGKINRRKTRSLDRVWKCCRLKGYSHEWRNCCSVKDKQTCRLSTVLV